MVLAAQRWTFGRPTAKPLLTLLILAALMALSVAKTRRTVAKVVSVTGQVAI